MVRFFIFLSAVFIFSMVGLFIWLVWSKIYIVIKRQDSTFDIEKEAHEKLKEKIKEDEA